MKIETEKVCECCGALITIDSTVPKQRNCYVRPPKGGRLNLLVTFCECPDCKEINILQMDTQSMLQDLRELTKIIARRSRALGGLRIDSRAGDKEKAERINKRLNKRRTELMEKYKMQDIYTKDGNRLK